MITTLTRAQRIARAQGITATDMRAISGLCPHRRPIDVYEEKIHPVIDPQAGDAPNEDMKRGIFIEDGIRRWYAFEVNGVVEEVGTTPLEGDPLIMASPDGKVTWPAGPLRPRALEIKCPRFHWDWEAGNADEEDGTDEEGRWVVPAYHRPQVLTEAAVLGVGSTDVAAFLSGGLRILNVPFDAAYFEDLRYLAHKFWHDFVLKREPPPVDESQNYARYLAKRHPRQLSEELLEATEDDILWAQRYAEARAAEKQAQADKKLARNTLAKRLGDAAGFVSDDKKTKVYFRVSVDSVKIDYKGIVENSVIDAGLLSDHTTIKQGIRSIKVYCK